MSGFPNTVLPPASLQQVGNLGVGTAPDGTTGDITVTGSVNGAVALNLNAAATHSVTFSNGGANMATLTAAGIFTLLGSGSGSSTAAGATSSTPTPSTGSAFTPNANTDCELSFVVTTAATFTVTYGPSTGAEHTLISGVALPIGTFFNKRIPAGWKVVITGTIADLGSILATSC